MFSLANYHSFYCSHNSLVCEHSNITPNALSGETFENSISSQLATEEWKIAIFDNFNFQTLAILSVTNFPVPTQ